MGTRPEAQGQSSLSKRELLQHIGELEAVETRHRQLFENMPSGVAVYQAIHEGNDFVFMDFNRAAERIEHIKRDDVIGRRVTQVFPGFKDFGLSKVFQRVWTTGNPEYFPAALYKDERDPGTWRENFVYRLPSGDVVAIHNDITDRKKAEGALRESERRFRSLYSSMSEGVALHEVIYDERGTPVDYVLLDVNPSYETILDLNRKDVVGKRASEAYGTGEAPYLDTYAEVAGSGRPQSFETYFPPMDKHFNISVFSPEKGRFATVFSDVNERKRTDEKLQHLYRVLLTIRSINQLIVQVDEEDSLLQKACEVLVGAGEYRSAWIGFGSHRSVRVTPVAQAAVDDGQLTTGPIAVWGLDNGKGPVITALQTKRPCVMRDILSDEEHPGRSSEARRLGYGSAAVLPLLVQGRAIGVLSVYAEKADALDDYEVDLLAELAGDISLGIEKIRQREGLRQAEEKYATLVERNNDGIVIIQDGTIEFVNASVSQLTGFALEELVGRPFVDYLAAEYREAALDRHRRRMGGEELRGDWQVEVLGSDGRRIPVETNGTRVDYRGRLVDMGILHDISDRKEAEEAIRRSQQDYRFLFDHVQDGIVMVDAETLRVVDANVAGVRMYGFESVEDVMGLDPFDYVAPEEKEGLARIVGDAVRTDLREVRELRMLKKDGGEMWVQASGALTAYRGSMAILGTIRDVTEQRKAREELRRSEETLRRTFESIADGVTVADEKGNIVDVNESLLRIHGCLSKDELVGKSAYSLISPAEHARVAESLGMLGDARAGSSVELELSRRDGSSFAGELTAAPLKDDSGNLVGFVAVTKDTTERKTARERLERSFVTLARTVSRAMGCRDPYTAGHQRRVASMSRMIGEKMGMQEDRLQGLYIGKLSVPEGLLSKPGRLLDEEMGLIRLHVKQGFEILREADLPWPVADMALHHHERLDGSGYPEGLGAEQISLENRILAVCDVVEAMCSHRPYRPARSMEEVIRELEAGRGSRYDPDVVDLMLDAIAKGELERLRDPLATVNGAPPG